MPESFRILIGRPPLRLLALAAIIPGLMLAGADACGADYASLTQVESASETRDYTQQVREKKFGEAQRAFLTGILLPQLSREANRSNIARTRQRIRELALRDAAQEVFVPVNELLRDEMRRLIADRDADPLLRVNATLMLGELAGADGKPWAPAAKPLAEAAGDPALPPAVRIAALTGLSRHVLDGDAAAQEAARPVVIDLVATRPAIDPLAADWIMSRAVDLLPAVTPPAAAIQATAEILADEQAAIDLRVRAAAAVGRLATPETGVDATALVGMVRSLAIAALSADLQAAEDRRFAKKISSPEGLQLGRAGEQGFGLAPPSAGGLGFGGGGMFGGQFGGGLGGPDQSSLPADEDAVSPLACRRDAWRLAMLAEAVRPARSGTGLAGLLEGNPGTMAADLATTLRQAALDLDAQPAEETLRTALEALQQQPPPGKANAPAKPATTPAGSGGNPPAASPFDQPAASPF